MHLSALSSSKFSSCPKKSWIHQTVTPLSPPLKPWQPLTSFLSLRVCLFWIIRVDGIRHPGTFCVWPLAPFLHTVRASALHSRWCSTGFIARIYSIALHLPTHALVDIWAVSTFWPLRIVLLWICVFMYLFQCPWSNLLALYLGVELLHHIAILCSTSWRNDKPLSQWLQHFTLPPGMSKSSSLSISSPTLPVCL